MPEGPEIRRAADALAAAVVGAPLTAVWFDAEALKAVRQWRVRPVMKDGVAIEAWRETRMSFEVPKDR